MIKNRYTAILVIFCIIISVSPTPSVRASTADPGPEHINVAIGSDSIPYYFLDSGNIPSGQLVDLWKLWSEKTGVRVIFKNYSFADSIKAVASGEADVHAGCFYSDMRNESLHFLSPVARVKTHFFFKKSISGINNLQDLRGFRIGVIEGDRAIEYLGREMPSATLAIFPDNEALFSAVEAGDIMTFIKDTSIALSMLSSRGLLHDFSYFPNDPLYLKNWYCAVRRGDSTLSPVIRRGMAAITSTERDAIRKKWEGGDKGDRDDVLTIACSKDYPPMTMLSQYGKPSGMLVDFWKLWAEKTGRKIKFRFFTWEETLSSVKEGVAHIHSGLFRSEPREDYLSFSKPFYRVESGFFYKPGRDSFKGPADLKGKRVGAEAGTIQLADLRKKNRDIIAVPLPSQSILLEYADRGEIDAFYAELISVRAHLERRGERGIFRLMPEGRFFTGLRAAVARGNSSLLRTVSEGIKSITPREIDEIESRWISDPALRQAAGNSRITGLTDSERAWLAENRVIPVAGESDWPPLDFADRSGNYKGVASDYIKLIGERLGVRFEVITDYSWDQMIDMARDRKVGGITCIARRKDREEFLNFSDPYFTCPYVIVTGRNHAEISGIKDLYGKKIAIERGYYLHTKLMQEYPEITPVPLKNTFLALQEVRENRADAYIGNLMVIKYLLGKNSITDLKIAAPSPWPGSRLSIGIRKDWPLLVSAVNKALATITPAEHRQINRNWLSTRPDEEIRLPEDSFNMAEKTWLAENKVMVVTSEASWPPINFVDPSGHYQGVTADYLDLISKRIGLRMEVITDYPWAQMLDMARKRKVDMITAIVKNREREEFLNFSKPYFTTPYVVVTRKPYPRIDNISDIADKKVALEDGFVLHKKMKKDYPGIKLHTTGNTLEALQAVERNEADAYVGNLMVIKYLIKTNGIKGLKIACPAPWPGSQLRFGLRKDWPELQTIIDKAIDDISVEEHQIINQKWMNYKPSNEERAWGTRLTPEDREWLSAHPNIRIGIDPNRAPFESISDENVHSGIASGYLSRVEKILKTHMDVQRGLSWQQALEKAENREIDLFPCISPTPERMKFLNFTKPYLSFPLVIASRASFPFISGLNDLEGRRVAVCRGYACHEILKSNHGNLNLVEVNTTEEALRLVSRAEADAFVGVCQANCRIFCS